MKKKILGLLMIIAFAFLLVGCTDTVKIPEIKSITINFNTNGGSFIESVEINENTIGSFTLPDNPTKEGYDFIGWYIDENLENVYESINLDNGNIVLYAKWQEKKSQKEIAQEAIKGSWSNGVLTATFEDETKKCSISLLGEDYEGTYSIDDNGEISMTVKVTLLPVTFTGKINNNKLTIDFMSQKYELNKVPEFNYELITLPEINLENLKGADFELTKKFNFKLNINMIDHSATNAAQAIDPNAETIYKDLLIEITLDCKVNGKVEKFKVASAKDFNASFEISIDFIAKADGKELEDDEYEMIKEALKDIKVYITNGVVYLSFVYPQASITGDETNPQITYTSEPMFLSCDFETLLSYLSLIYAAESGGEYDYDEEYIIGEDEEYSAGEEVGELDDVTEWDDLDDYADLGIMPFDFTSFNFLDTVKKINETFNSALTTAYTYGVSEEVIQEVLNTIDSFKPVTSADGNKITYSITKETILTTLSKLKDFVSENKTLIITASMLIGDEPITEQDYNEILSDIEESYDAINNSIDLDNFYYEINKEDNHIKSINKNIDFTAYLSDSKKSYFSVSDNLNIKVNSIDVVIEFPDFTDYIDINQILMMLMMGGEDYDYDEQYDYDNYEDYNYQDYSYDVD